MGVGVTNGGLIAEIVALQVRRQGPAGARPRATSPPVHECRARQCAHLVAQALVGARPAPGRPVLTLLPCRRRRPRRHPTPQDVSSTEAAIIYTLEPVFGASLAYIMLGERWGTSGWVGAGLIVVSCLVAQLLGVEKDEHEKHDDVEKP